MGKQTVVYSLGATEREQDATGLDGFQCALVDALVPLYGSMTSRSGFCKSRRVEHDDIIIGYTIL